MLRIVVTGSESTGKTTLAEDLASWLGLPWVPEYSRVYAERKGSVLDLGDVDPIARGHMAAEDDARLAAPEAAALVLDADLNSTLVYSNFYYETAPEWIPHEALRRKADLYLLAETDIPWVADGVRDVPADRETMHRLFVEQLNRVGATWVPIDGLGRRRMDNAIAAVRGWRAASVHKLPTASLVSGRLSLELG